jgi:hypothetical protein
VGRLHALWTLDGLHKLDPKLIQKALSDPEAGVRENAIILAESALPRSPELVTALLQMEHDPDSRVQFQLLCTSGGISSPASMAVQDRLLAKNIEDPWMQIAALSASPERAPQLFKAARAFANQQTDARATFFARWQAVIAARRKPEGHRFWRLWCGRPRRSLRGGAWRACKACGGGRGDGARDVGTRGTGRGANSRDPATRDNMGQDLLVKLFEGPDKEIRRASLRMLASTGLPGNSAALLKSAAATAERADADPDLRADSIGLLALDDPAAHQAMLKALVTPKQPEAVQAAAVRVLGRLSGAEIGTFLLDHWKAMTPAVRMDAADAMFTDPDRPKLLVEAIKSDRVQPWTLAFRHKRNLVMSRDPALREEARKILEEKAGYREKVLKRYEAALSATGDPRKGQEVFERVAPSAIS